MLRLAVPSLDETDVAAVAEVLRTGFLVQGRHVEAFEHAVATYTGALHAVAVSNCTSALHLSLLAIGIGPGDVVAVPAYSWPATINVVALAGAEPAIVDVDPRTFNMDPSALEALFRQRRVSAVMPVHAFGGMAQMVEIAALAADRGVPVVEDAACALGATLDGVQAGRRGLTGCFSFHPRKAITTGEGGVVVTDDEDVAMRLRALRNHGLDPEARTADFMLPGFNARMTEFQGALGLRQMEKLTRILASRRHLARRYDELLAGTPVTPPRSIPGSTHAYQSYVVLLPDSVAHRRAEVIAGLRDAGFETTIGTYALPFIRYVREKYGFGAADFPNVSSIDPRALSLPLHEQVTERDQERVVSCLLALIDH
ncbi:MAG TPA: DegT/DnrJ/EryC1/StrS family aminotransferase [Rhodothermales bacterium]